MRTLKIELPDGRTSPLYVGSGLLSQFKEVFDISGVTKVFLLTEPVVKNFWLEKISAGLNEFQVLEVESGEHSKNVDVLARIWKELLEKEADRKSLLINLGGGMITDLGGFAASTYMRGIQCINIPTTLLSQVDASIGGKTGINHGGIKNSVGSFSQPLGVMIDIETLSTLPARDFAAGFSEVLKHGLIADEEYFNEVASLDISNVSSSKMEKLVLRSCEIKRDIVSRDEREGDYRKLLNFGHTLGHALESDSHSHGEPLLHGEAVSLGVVGEAYLSFSKGNIELSDVERIQAAFKQLNLPVKLSQKFKEEYSFNSLYSLMLRDKKNTGKDISWTLLERVGKGVIDQQVDKAVLQEALEYIS